MNSLAVELILSIVVRVYWRHLGCTKCVKYRSMKETLPIDASTNVCFVISFATANKCIFLVIFLFCFVLFCCVCVRVRVCVCVWVCARARARFLFYLFFPWGLLLFWCTLLIYLCKKAVNKTGEKRRRRAPLRSRRYFINAHMRDSTHVTIIIIPSPESLPDTWVTGSLPNRLECEAQRRGFQSDKSLVWCSVSHSVRTLGPGPVLA